MFGRPSQPILERTWFKIFCRADEGYSLTVRDGAVVLARANPGDEHQHWYKDTRHTGSVKDDEGHQAFALVNKATGLAIKHSLGQSHPVELVAYNQEYKNESLMWTESKDVGKGFRCIRMASNISLNLDAFHGDKDHGGVRDGTTLVLWEWCKGKNQSWKILPLGREADAPPPACGVQAPPVEETGTEPYGARPGCGGAGAYPPPAQGTGYHGPTEAYPPPAQGTGYHGPTEAYPPPAQGTGYHGPTEGYPPPAQGTGYYGAEIYPPPGAGHWYPGRPATGYQQPYHQQPSAGYGYGNTNKESYPPQHQHYGYGGAATPVGVGSYGNMARPLSTERTVRIICRANQEYSITVRDGTVCLAPANPADDFQHWVKDMRRSTSIKDEEGCPAFALVNKVTGEAIKHSLGQGHPVKLVAYNPEYVDESVLWTESKDVGDGFRCVRMVNNIYLNFDAFHGDKDHGGVRDGTTIVLWEWCKGDNQCWKILPYCECFPFTTHTFHLCKATSINY